MNGMEEMTFSNLVSGISAANKYLKDSAACAINQHVTARNWLIGYYIFNYEQKGMDRATYGEGILKNLASRLNEDGLSYGNLKLYRQFYISFPNLGNAIASFISTNAAIGQSVIAQSSHNSVSVPGDKLFNRLSYTHLLQLLPIEDPLERAFYEIECIKGVWSVRELQRQIKSNCYLRSGLSKRPD